MVPAQTGFDMLARVEPRNQMTGALIGGFVVGVTACLLFVGMMHKINN